MKEEMIKTYRLKIDEKRIDNIESRLSIIENDVRTIRHDLNNILVKMQWVEMKLNGEL